MNNITILGRITKDPELKTNGNTTYCRFAVAVPRTYGKEKVTDFFNCTAFGKQAEAIEKYIKKGNQLCIQGRMEFNVKDNVTYHNLSVTGITFISTKSNTHSDDSDDFDNEPKQKSKPAKTREPEPPVDDDDEYPF